MKPYVTMRRFAAAVLVMAAGLVACAQLGVVAPENLGESLLYGYKTNATVRLEAASAVSSKVITKSDAQHVLNTTNTARTALDEVRKAGCPNMNEDGGKVDPSAPACLSELPSTVIGKAKFAVGLVNQSLGFMQSHGLLKSLVAKFTS